jgi:hypothetical protein
MGATILAAGAVSTLGLYVIHRGGEKAVFQLSNYSGPRPATVTLAPGSYHVKTFFFECDPSAAWSLISVSSKAASKEQIMLGARNTARDFTIPLRREYTLIGSLNADQPYPHC